MATTNCPACNKLIPVASSFCPFCAVPVKCKACGETWLKDAVACYQCGIKLEAAGSAIAANSIQFEQAGKNRKLTASFSDNVGVHLSGVLHGLISGQPPIQRPFSPGTTGNPARKALAFPSQSNTVVDATVVHESGDVDEAEILQRIFRLEGDRMILLDNQLKHNSKRDFSIRLTMLFLYAHQLQGRQQVPRSELKDILEQEKAYDSNTRYWLSKAEELALREDLVELRPAGEKKAKQFLAEIGDNNLVKKATSKGGRPSKRSKNAQPDENASAPREKTAGSGRMGPWKAIGVLVKEGYFNEKRTIGSMQQYCADERAWRFATKDVSSSLTRMVKDGKLKRTKNADGQFEYYAS